jgi:hypothetical protein
MLLTNEVVIVDAATLQHPAKRCDRCCRSLRLCPNSRMHIKGDISYAKQLHLYVRRVWVQTIVSCAYKVLGVDEVVFLGKACSRNVDFMYQPEEFLIGSAHRG